jgi:hypothetical protein
VDGNGLLSKAVGLEENIGFRNETWLGEALQNVLAKIADESAKSLGGVLVLSQQPHRSDFCCLLALVFRVLMAFGHASSCSSDGPARNPANCRR